MNVASKPSLLMDLRPCYEGFAGIPQEARLLWAMFARMGLPRFGGLASGLHYTHRFRPTRTAFEGVLAQTQALIAQDTQRQHWPIPLSLLPTSVRGPLFNPWMVLSEGLRAEKLDLQIDPVRFEDYLWMKLFDNTLPPSDRALIGRAEYFLTELGHEYARSFSILPRILQRRLNCEGWGVFFAASVTPYRVAPGTAMVVRYYDALPLLSPHTIGAPWMHALSHARMLHRNMRDGALFVCDSEPVRQDLLGLFPGAEAQVHTIPVIVSSGFYPDPQPERVVRTILARRRSAVTSGRDAKAGADGAESAPFQSATPQSATFRSATSRRTKPAASLPKLFLAVSTLEPRKNYLKLFRAFDQARGLTRKPMRLVIVANKGWRSDLELTELKRMVAEGVVHHLSGVPADELRLLYSAAHAVIAPSRAEGFDYSGAEGMACGTPVIASDIPVHRWVYGDAADYFDPYSTDALAQLMADYAGLPRDSGHLAERSSRGLREARRYHPDTLAPVWERTLIDLTQAHDPTARTKRRSVSVAAS